MKNKSLVTAGLLAVGLASSASAVDVYITGSTAFRANVNNALNTAIFDGGSPTTVNPSFASGASQQTFTGTIGGTAFNVFVDFTGSEAGIASLTGLTIANNVQDDNGINHNGNLPGTPSPTFRNTSGAGTFTHAPDISMADTTSAVSLSKNTAITRVGGAPVGIVQFLWMKGANNSQTGYTRLSNVSTPQLNVLLGGQQPLSFITGNPADINTLVDVVGRNKGSGTRVNTMIETLYGVNTTVEQYGIHVTYTGGVLVNAAKSTTLSDGDFLGIGNDGYDSGSGVAAILASTGSGLTTLPIGYIGLGDATGATLGGVLGGGTLTFSGGSPSLPVGGFSASGGQFLTLNGVPYSDAAIVLGAYDFFGHETMYIANTSSAGTFAGSLFTALQSTLTGGTGGIPATGLLADRPTDIGYVAPK